MSDALRRRAHRSGDDAFYTGRGRQSRGFTDADLDEVLPSQQPATQRRRVGERSGGGRRTASDADVTRSRGPDPLSDDVVDDVVVNTQDDQALFLDLVDDASIGSPQPRSPQDKHSHPLPRRLDLLDLLEHDDLVDLASDIPQPADTSRPVTRDRQEEVQLPAEIDSIDETEDDDSVDVEDPLARAYGSGGPSIGAREDVMFFMGIWADMSGISQDHYRMLAEGLNTLFGADLPLTLVTVKRYRRHLPLAQIKCKQIDLDTTQLSTDRATAGNRPTTGYLYYFDREQIIDILLHNARQYMYFGPAVLSDVISEPWHGTHWSESICCASGTFPFYGDQVNDAIFPSDVVLVSELTGAQVSYMIMGIWKDCRGQLTTPPQDAPWCLSVAQIDTNTGIVSDRRKYIPPSSVIRRLQSRPSSTQQRHPIQAEKEVAYFGRERLQREFVHRPRGRRVLSVPTFDFVDGFGLYRNMYRSLLGVYMLAACLRLYDTHTDRHSST